MATICILVGAMDTVLDGWPCSLPLEVERVQHKDAHCQLFSIAVYALEKHHVNISNDTQMVPYHTCMTCSHAVYPCHGICLTGWIEACI